MRGAIAFVCCLVSLSVQAQEQAQPQQGLQTNPSTLHALTNGQIIVAPGREIESGTILLTDGKISAVGGNVEIPQGYKVWDMTGKVIYPGFIDAYIQIGPEPSEEPPPPVTGPVSWNINVRSHIAAENLLKLDTEHTKKLRSIGLSTIQAVPRQGVFRGTSAVVQLTHNKNQVPLLPNKTHVVALEYGAYDGNVYPGSLMGSIALIRQTLYDSQWYDRSLNNKDTTARPELNQSLAALNGAANGSEKMVFHTNDELDFARVFAIGSEFDLDVAVMGNGYEYRSLETLQEYGKTILVPIAYPKAPAVDNPEKALDVSLATLQHWELAPSNLAFLADGEVPFAITSHGLEKPEKHYWKNLRTAVNRGLASSEALAGLTTGPARILGLEDQLGTIEASKIANLVVADGDLFTNKQAKIHTVWVDGKPHHTEHHQRLDPRGTWRLSWSGTSGPSSIQIDGTLKKLKVPSAESDIKVEVEGDQLLLVFADGKRVVSYARNNLLEGIGETTDGTPFLITGQRVQQADTDEEKDDESEPVPLVWSQYPAGAFGVSQSQEKADNIVFRNATIWTSTESGVLENTDLLVRRGRIQSIGQDLSAPRGTIEVDATDKHITAGIIDAHSHSGISQSVNEATHAVTVEVRVGDIVNPTDIALYRELAGGVTTINQLHGSANPIGGQNQIIKLRWGLGAEDLKFKDAPKGVKFALGENVKQSNWGDDFVTRYPQTRMGVEQIMRDTFIAARDYQKTWQDFRSKKTRVEPRRDLRLDAMIEILEAARWVHIHSYRQDEVLMFVRLAQEFGLKVGTFQHILEGYKVADAMAEIGAGASTFSDWWAYKFEVFDAIPYNGALMHNAGVLTSFNSDSNELARRLNTEAAKAVKYGGVSETEALNFVTINPAKQLGIADRVGSLEPGKDADLVIWSTHPLSTFAIAEQTWIDGTKYFDIESDLQARQTTNRERQRLIGKILKSKFKSKDKDDTDGSNPLQNDPYHGGHDANHCTTGEIHQC